MNSLMPFYGLPVETMQQRTREAEKIPETFTLVVHDGKVELQWNDDYSRDTWWASRPRADSQINLMEPFIKDIGTFRYVVSCHVLWLLVKEVLMVRATFTIHDQPTMLLDYKRQQELMTAAKDHTGEY